MAELRMITGNIRRLNNAAQQKPFTKKRCLTEAGCGGRFSEQFCQALRKPRFFPAFSDPFLAVQKWGIQKTNMTVMTKPGNQP